MKIVNHIFTDISLFIIYSLHGVQREVHFQRSSDEELFLKAHAAVKAGDIEAAVKLLDSRLRVAEATGGRVSYTPDGGRILLDGQPLPATLAVELRKLVAAGASPQSLFNFWDRLKRNPDNYVREQLFAHVKHNGVMLLPDGRFLLYKRVRGNMTSHHDGRTKHVVGEELSMPREHCERNPRVSCGAGLHAAPYQHAERVFHSGPFLRLICDPEHVVSCPKQDSEKIRFCSYYVDRVLATGEGPSVGIDAATVADLDKFVAEKAKVERREERKERVRPEKSDSGAKALKPVKKRAVLARRVIERSTDRVTIPAELMLKAGFTPGAQAAVILTDSRSRFLVIVKYNKRNSVKSRFCSPPMLLTSTGAFSIRNNLLSHARLDKVKNFKVSITDRLTLEIEEAK